MRVRQHTHSTQRGDPDLAQFFTPTAVAEFIWHLLEVWGGEQVRPGTRIIDPAAGRGHLLDVAVRRLGPEGVLGVEIDPRLSERRLGLARQLDIVIGDGLIDHAPDVFPGSFGVVVGNPPFGKLDGRPDEGSPDRGCFEVAGLVNAKDESDSRPGTGWIAMELLFLERALSLAAEGGLIAYIMPEGFFANQRLQRVRDWVLTKATLVGVVELPGAVFRGRGLHAQTSVLVLRKEQIRSSNAETILLRTTGTSLQKDLDEMAAAAGDPGATRERVAVLQVRVARLFGKRWDSRYWIGLEAAKRAVTRHPLRSLGDFISHITYGPIVTGSRPVHDPVGIPVVRQGDFLESGLDLERALRVSPGGRHDPERSRACEGDLLLPRSGAGALGRNRMAVYDLKQPANVGCFVDLIRLQEVNPFFVWLFLKTAPGWGQIQALINGVGTPNINFTELRSLEVPIMDIQEQDEWQKRYVAEVRPLHTLRLQRSEFGSQADDGFRRLVADLQATL